MCAYSYRFCWDNFLACVEVEPTQGFVESEILQILRLHVFWEIIFILKTSSWRIFLITILITYSILADILMIAFHDHNILLSS